ncbi:piggyBac transposable element-derived protein 4-like [Euwallacea similis]|uniref:piggyBac transposable element-derived protein 4-like n=1 Tax=Euwallacea similis TaxID=1736056 RepID=UPI00344D5D24
MLVGFRGRCPFRMYMKAKPVKYGIKIMCLCDFKTHYLVNAFVYTGKMNEPNPRKLSISTRSVLALVEPIANSNRNVTGDNWFTSLELVGELKKLRLTYVGTMRKNKREILPQFQPNKNYEVESSLKSLFGFTRENTIVSYVPKKNKSVIMLSTMHHDNSVDQESKKPEIIAFYNATKGGVDALDQKCALYSSSRRCRRWPLVIWYAIMGIAIINSHIFHAANPGLKKNRSDFMKELGMSLINEQLKLRFAIPSLSRELRLIISKALGTEMTLQDPPRQEGRVVRRRCYLCPRSKDTKHSTVCSECHKAICKTHSLQQVICTSCKE